ncbi:hypothetical protein OXYTRIMIC_628 [Oxytricha trifallax]|uniref:Uncharacterized protein n=1 Tax=Oxytricha trifallax TaxID=1172189 RepID=A0A073HYT2_9SPIT|nr:hypothetical protein OXYTRIMIC_628 [Oxytricha trifallax]
MKITNWLNTGQIPQYLKEGRLILLSKTVGDHNPEVNNTRPIVVNSIQARQSKKLFYTNSKGGKDRYCKQATIKVDQRKNEHPLKLNQINRKYQELKKEQYVKRGISASRSIKGIRLSLERKFMGILRDRAK